MVLLFNRLRKSMQHCSSSGLTLRCQVEDMKIRAKLMLMVPITNPVSELTSNILLEATRIKQKSKPRVVLTVSRESVHVYLTKKDTRSSEDDLINVAHDKIACVKTSPQIKSVVSITHVSPDGRMMCCCFKLTSLERKQRGLKRKCKITGVELQDYINCCRNTFEEENSSTQSEDDTEILPSEDILFHSRSQSDADTQSTHIPAFNVTSLSGSEVSSVKQCHLHVSIPSAFQPYYDCLWMYSKSTLFKDRQKSRLIPLFNTVQLPATNTIITLDTEFTEEDNEVALILMNMPLHSARC